MCRIWRKHGSHENNTTRHQRKYFQFKTTVVDFFSRLYKIKPSSGMCPILRIQRHLQACSFKKTKKKKKKAIYLGRAEGIRYPLLGQGSNRKLKLKTPGILAHRLRQDSRKKHHASLKWTYYAELWRLKCIWHMWYKNITKT